MASLNLMPIDGITLVENIVNSAISAIQCGQWRKGAKIPSIRRMAGELGVSPFTVAEAYDRLVTLGYLAARPGSGFYVEARRESRPPDLPAAPRVWPVDEYWLLRKIYQQDANTLFAGCGWLPSHWYDAEAQQKALRQLARDAVVAPGYGDPKGFLPLREHLADRLSERGIQARADDIALTQGASRALDMAACALLQAGDTVLVDDPGYCNLLSCLAFREFKLVPVPWTEHGPDLEQLRALLLQHRPRAFFTNPWLQNPTGASYAPSIAHQVLRLAEEYDFLIVEDNVSADFAGDRQPALAALDGLKRVLYIDSFSKSLSPGLRVGYLCGPSELLERIVHYKMMSGLTSPELNERLALELVSEGRYRRQLERLRARLAEAQAQCQQLFLEHGWQLFARPANGLFLLARPPGELDARRLAEQAQQHKILLAPGHLFRAYGMPSDWLRFNVAFSQDRRLWDFLSSPPQ